MSLTPTLDLLALLTEYAKILEERLSMPVDSPEEGAYLVKELTKTRRKIARQHAARQRADEQLAWELTYEDFADNQREEQYAFDAVAVAAQHEEDEQEEDANLAAALQLDQELAQELAPEQALGNYTCPCCRCEIQVLPGEEKCGWFVHGTIFTIKGGRFDEVRLNPHLTLAAREELMSSYLQLPPMVRDRREGVPYLAGCLNKLYLTENGFVQREE